VATACAMALNLPLAVYVVKKLGAPGNPEFAIGAVGEDGEPLLDSEIIKRLGVSEEYVAREVAERRRQIRKQVLLFRDGESLPGPLTRPVIIVDDGIATGSTVVAAAQGLRLRGATRIVGTAPVGSRAGRDMLAPHVDDIVLLQCPEDFWAVGQYYERFEQVSDAEVGSIMRSFRRSTDIE